MQDSISVRCPENTTECLLRSLEAQGLIQPRREEALASLQQQQRNGSGRNLYAFRGRSRVRGRGNRYRPDCWIDDEQAPPTESGHSTRQGKRLRGSKNPSRRQDQPWRTKPCLWQEKWGPAEWNWHTYVLWVIEEPINFMIKFNYLKNWKRTQIIVPAKSAKAALKYTYLF